MRSAVLPCLAILSTCALPALAAGRFGCGGAEVRIEVLARDTRVAQERAEGVVTVSRNGADTILRYRGVDFIGGECVKGADDKPLVVFQAHCGGSACQDGANWGVIDPGSLRVLVVPTDSNRQEAQRLLGGTLPALNKLSVEREASRQGVALY